MVVVPVPPMLIAPVVWLVAILNTPVVIPENKLAGDVAVPINKSLPPTVISPVTLKVLPILAVPLTLKVLPILALPTVVNTPSTTAGPST